MRPRPTRLVPPVYFAIALCLIVLVERFVPDVMRLPEFARVLGWTSMGAGLVLFVTTVAAFHHSGTPLKPFKGPGTLMTGGMFRVSRNPIYLGMTLMLLGVGLRGGEALPLVVPFVFAAIIEKRFILSEEEFLTDHFGDAYRSYRSRVRRWL